MDDDDDGVSRGRSEGFCYVIKVDQTKCAKNYIRRNKDEHSIDIRTLPLLNCRN